jgi:hypothetical protein
MVRKAHCWAHEVPSKQVQTSVIKSKNPVNTPIYGVFCKISIQVNSKKSNLLVTNPTTSFLFLPLR